MFTLNDILETSSSKDLDNLKQTQYSNDNYYNPKFADGKNNKYSATIRFLSIPKSLKIPSITSYKSCYMKHPETGVAKYLTRPYNVNEDSPCPLYKYWRKLKDSKNSKLNELTNLFSSSQKHVCLIQVLDDKIKPENNGKVFFFRFGKIIMDKIEAERTPESNISKSYDPFAWTPIGKNLAGRRFILVVTKKNDYENYEQSKFDGDSYPYIMIKSDDDDDTYETINVEEALSSPESRKAVEKFYESLKDKIEKLPLQGHKKWVTEDYEHYNSVVEYVESIEKNGDSKSFLNSNLSSTSASKTLRNIDDDISNDEETIEDIKSISKKNNTQTTNTKKVTSAVIDDDEDDEDFDDFDEELDDL